jgi:hypothetical protein
VAVMVTAEGFESLMVSKIGIAADATFKLPPKTTTANATLNTALIALYIIDVYTRSLKIQV